METPVAIIGMAATVAPHVDESLESLIFGTATDALGNAGVGHGEVDGVVTAGSDMVDGRAITSMINSGPAGGHLKDEVNLASSGVHALVEGYLAIASGRHRLVLVSSWGKASEGMVSVAEHLTTDPYFDRDAPLTELAAMGMQAQVFRSKVSRAEDAAVAVAVKNAAGSGTPMSADEVRRSPVVAAPLRSREVAQPRDGACSLVLASAGVAQSHTGAVYVAGIGWAADRYRLSERDLLRLPHLGAAASAAFDRARATVKDMLFVEAHDYSADAEVLACSALGLCELDRAPGFVLDGATSPDGPHPMNVSGGSLGGEVPFAEGLRRVVGAAQELGQSEDGARPRAMTAVQATSGFAGQFQTVVVLDRDGGGK